MSKLIKESDISTFRDYINEVSGLYFEDGKFPFLEKVISGRIAETESDGFAEYYRRLTRSRHSKNELAVLGGILTVGETYFFRNRDHWNAFEECVMPWVINQCRTEGRHRIRIWSAGCATGEEPYTIAIAVSRSLPDRSRWTVEILGSDINPMAIAAARRGVYRENSFRGVPASIRNEYFEPMKQGELRPRACIRNMVSFQKLNLLDSQDMGRVRNVDVIFCRNVLIYFDTQSVEVVMGHLHNALRTGGYLFLGHSENNTIKGSRFATISVRDTFVARALPAEGSSEQSMCIPVELEWANEKRESELQEILEEDKEQEPRVQATEEKSKDVDLLPVDISALKESKALNTDVEHLPDVKKLRERAIEYLISEESSQSLRLFRQVLEREPQDVASLLGTAILLAGSGNGDAALRCCQKVLATDPMSAEAHCVMALVYESSGDYGQALVVLEKAIYLDSCFSMAHFRLAGLYERLHRESDRQRALRNTLNSLPKDDETRIRVYSGGFDRSTVSRVCKQRQGETVSEKCDGALMR